MKERRTKEKIKNEGKEEERSLMSMPSPGH